MEWDASRISAAIPSGVGFLGAGLIFKEAQKNEATGLSQHVVHGLTTATSLWLSAAVGVACGGEFYFISAFTTAIMLVLLRFGPRQRDFEGEHDDDEEDEQEFNRPMTVRSIPNYGADKETEKSAEDESDETEPMMRSRSKPDLKRMGSISRSRAAISTVV